MRTEARDALLGSGVPTAARLDSFPGQSLITISTERAVRFVEGSPGSA